MSPHSTHKRIVTNSKDSELSFGFHNFTVTETKSLIIGNMAITSTQFHYSIYSYRMHISDGFRTSRATGCRPGCHRTSHDCCQTMSMAARAGSDAVPTGRMSGAGCCLNLFQPNHDCCQTSCAVSPAATAVSQWCACYFGVCRTSCLDDCSEACLDGLPAAG